MKPFSTLVRIPLLSFAFWMGACRENPREAEHTDDPPPPEERIAELRREIEAGRQNIENLEAFVQMERAKVENDPEYEQAFLLEALDEQRETKEAVEAGENRLRELTRPNE